MIRRYTIDFRKIMKFIKTKLKKGGKSVKKKKLLLKKGVSIALSVAIMAGVLQELPADFFYKFANAAVTVTYKPEKLGVKVIPAKLLDNSTFMRNYVNGQGDGDYTITSGFEYTDYSNLKGGIGNDGKLDYSKTYWHKDNKHWYAEFENTLSSATDAYSALSKKGDLYIGYNVDLVADYHKHIGAHRKKKWDVAVYRLWSNKKNYASFSCEEKNDEGNQNYKNMSKIESYGNNNIYLEFNHRGCDCGSSKSRNNSIYIADKTAPRLKNVYGTTDAEGTKKVESGCGFKQGKKGYVVLEFTENIRFSDGANHNLKLNTNLKYTQTDQSVTGDSVQADLVRLSGNKMVFEFTVPQNINKKKTDVYIDSISENQPWITTTDSFDYVILDEKGNKYNVKDNIQKDMKCKSQVTDLAGNAIDFTFNKDQKKTLNLENFVYLDNVKPTLHSVQLSGNKIPEKNLSSNSQGNSGNETDAGSVYAGVGDTLRFKCTFTEALKISDTTKVKAVLNIKDKDGKQVKLSLKSNKSQSAKSVLGKDAKTDNVGVIEFESLNVTSDMMPQNVDNKPIRIVSIEGLSGAADYRGNTLEDTTVVSVSPDNQAYIDTLSPKASTIIKPSGEEYSPYGEGFDFTMPITINDDNSLGGNYVSNITGKNGKFSLILSAGDDKNYEWYADTTQQVRNDAAWKSAVASTDASKATKNTFPQLGEGNVTYIHIRLNQTEDYGYVDNIFKGSLVVYPEDIAGNKGENVFKISHNADAVKPLVEEQAYETSISNNTATLKTSLKVTDRFGVKAVSYYWGENGDPEKLDMTGRDNKNFTFETSTVFEKTTDRGSKKLTVTVVDNGGNDTTFTKDYSYRFDSLKSKYNIEKGSVTDPLTKLNVVINIPDEVTIGGNVAEPRTMMLIPMGKEDVNGEEKNTYLAFMRSLDIRNENINCFEGMPSNKDDSYAASSYYGKGYWYKLAGDISDEGAGTFTMLDTYSTGSLYKVGEFVNSLYGKVDITFVTSLDLTDRYNEYDKDSSKEGEQFNFTSDSSRNLIEKEAVYFSPRFDYEVEFMPFADENNENIEDRLCVDKQNRVAPSENRISSLENVSLVMNITNTRETGETMFGCAGIDVSNGKSYYRLQKVNSDGSLGTVLYTKDIYAVESQNITFQDYNLKESGLYGISVHIETKDGQSYDYEPDKYIFVDKSSATMTPSTYVKTYIKTDIYDPTDKYPSGKFTTTSLDQFGKPVKFSEDVKVVNVGVADNPQDNITCDPAVNPDAKNMFVFKCSTSNAGTYADNCQADFTWKVRAWSSEDADGEVNASWYDMSGEEFGYQLVGTGDFSEDAYYKYDDDGNLIPTLPVYVGDNVVNYQIKGLNNKVYSGQITLNVNSQAPVVDISEEKTATESTLTLNIDNETKLNGGTVRWYKYGWSSAHGSTVSIENLEPYKFDESVNNVFCVYDTYGNLSVVDYEVTDVDGKGPDRIVTYPNRDNNSDMDIMSDTAGYHFTITVQDNVKTSVEDTYITYDKEYSAVLLGLKGDERKENTEQVTVQIPVNLEGDMIWTGFDDSYYGIYRTEVKSLEEDVYTIEVWGTFKYDEESEPYASSDCTLTISAKDARGNVSPDSVNSVRKYTRMNAEPNIMLDYEKSTSGNVIIKSYSPLKSVNSYGAGKLTRDMDWYGECYVTTLPMIVSEGVYTIDVTDIFGQSHKKDIEVALPNEAGIQVKYSTTELTNENVTVALETKQTTDTDRDTITEINAYYDDSKDTTKADAVGIIDAVNPAAGSIVMEKNGRIDVKTSSGNVSTFRVTNIDKVLEPATIKYYYDGDAEPVFADGSTDTVKTPVTAVLECEEDVEGTNGTLRHVFSYESKKGETYTFEYKDEAGNTGKMTATLPYNVDKKSEDVTPAEDTEAPEYEMLLFGMRNNKYEYLSNFMNDGNEVSDTAKEFVAQKYGVNIEITDDSKTKVILKNSGAAAPTSYKDSSDSVEGVKLSGTTVTISENAKFDLYIADENNNISAIRGFDFTSIDNTAPNVTAEYKLEKDTKGFDIIRVWFIAENNETILTTDKDIKAVLTTETITVNGVEQQTDVIKYYKDYTDNVSETFTYKDVYGNAGSVLVEVNAIDTAYPKCNSVKWFGIGTAQKPQDVKNTVNNDVTASINVSKPVSSVKFFAYDASKENGKGDEIDSPDIIKAEFAGTNVNITFKNNTAAEIVAEITASGNGRSVYEKLPQISFIDKQAPKVTVAGETLADNKLTKTYVINTDEPSLYTEDSVNGEMKLQHVISVTENGTKTLKFTDAAGNVTKYDINTTDIDDKVLSLKFSKNADGSNAENSVENMKLQSGEKIYIQANKAALISTGSEEKNVTADKWTEFTLSADSGIHILKAVDSVTGKEVYANLLIQIRDSIAPEIMFSTKTVYIKDDVSVDEMKKAVEDGVTVRDNRDGDITDYDISGVPDKVEAGYYIITFTAKDSSGNVSTVMRTLYIAGKNEPVLSVNGINAAPFDITVLSSENIKAEVQGTSESGLMIKVRPGVRTTGQMKYGNNVLKNGGTYKAEETGFYTIYVRTRERKEYVTYVYVDID